MYLGAIAMDINTNFCDLPPFFFCEKNTRKKNLFIQQEEARVLHVQEYKQR